MPTIVASESRTPAGDRTPVETGKDPIRQWISDASHLLPAQGPIEVFVHHNTLHSFQHRNFHDAVRLGQQHFGAEPYLSEIEYRDMLGSGVISGRTIESVLNQFSGAKQNEIIAGLCTRKEIRLAQMRNAFHTGSDSELKWIISEAAALSRFIPNISDVHRARIINSAFQSWNRHRFASIENDHLQRVVELANPDLRETNASESYALHMLWHYCHRAVNRHRGHRISARIQTRPRSRLLTATGEDIDAPVNELLIRFASAFLDQGYSVSNLPNRELGFFECFKSIYRSPSWTTDRWLKPLHQLIATYDQSESTAIDVISESLLDLGIEADDRKQFIQETLLALGGWAGMVWQLESKGHAVVHPIAKNSLEEFLAVRLILERLAIRDLARNLPTVRNGHSTRSTSSLIDDIVGSHVASSGETDLQTTFYLFQLAQALGWTPAELQELNQTDWDEILDEIRQFDDVARRQVFQEAWELDYRNHVFGAITQHCLPSNRSPAKPVRKSFQFVTCIDDREESFRRHLEEVDPHCETFGAAGFFSVAMYYRGSTDAFYQPLCPGVITPSHYVQEEVSYSHEGLHQSRTKLRSRLGLAGHTLTTQSRNAIGGLIAGLAGGLAGAPLLANFFFPKITTQLQHGINRTLRPSTITNLQLERYRNPPGPNELHVGYSVEEMAEVVCRLLTDLGLETGKGLSRLMFVCGHGSSSLNNPHESAYCCGACAGKRGGPNARAFAQMANDWRVRQHLEKTGMVIPQDTVFVGAYHNTCSDEVHFFDLDRLPSSHRPDFDAAREKIEEARARNAHERCRRFESAPLDQSYSEALRHVETRSEDLSQSRPEYNHATNALCIVGRREWTKNLFLDRRAFLTSYDPSSDDREAAVLTRILSAVVPVCVGINLEYYFSRVDTARYGCGSKLPHNLVGLLGVMEGTASDLRTGLSEQMVEIHSPIRITFLIEASQGAMETILDRNPAISQVFSGGWAHLAIIDPDSATILTYEDQQFVEHRTTAILPMKATSSLQCYMGNRLDLPVISISPESCSPKVVQ